MDYLMPDDDTMELMRREFAKLKACDDSSAYALELAKSLSPERDTAYIPTAILFLYFVKRLSYNVQYGTAIFNSDRGMGRIYSVPGTFRNINNLR